jgi:tetratricopeptide (TPR) repeat protein
MRPRQAATWIAAVVSAIGLIAAADVDTIDLKRTAALTEKGFTALKAGNRAKAAELYEKALTILPFFPDANLGFGHIAMGERDFSEALRLYERAKTGYLEMGDDLFRIRLRKYNQARQEISRQRDRISALQSEIGGTTQRSVARIRAESLQGEQAIQQLEAIELPEHDESDPVPGEIDFYIGNALLNLDRPEDAISSWRECAKKSPQFPLVQHNLAVAYWRVGRLDEALRFAERAEQLGYTAPPGFKADIERSIAARDNTEGVSAAR